MIHSSEHIFSDRKPNCIFNNGLCNSALWNGHCGEVIEWSYYYYYYYWKTFEALIRRHCMCVCKVVYVFPHILAAVVRACIVELSPRTSPSVKPKHCPCASAKQTFIVLCTDWYTPSNSFDHWKGQSFHHEDNNSQYKKSSLHRESRNLCGYTYRIVEK